MRATGSALRTGCQHEKRGGTLFVDGTMRRNGNTNQNDSLTAIHEELPRLPGFFRHQRTHRCSNLPRKVLLLLTFTHLRSRRRRLPHASPVRTVLHPRSPTQRGDARSLPQIRKVGIQDGPQAESRHVGTSNASGLTFNDIDHASRLLDSEASRPDNHVLEVTARA